MSCAGSPHGGEGRRPRSVDGSVPRNIFEDGSPPATPEQFVEELNQVGSTAFQFTVADVPAVLSLLAGISDEKEEEGSAEESSRCDPRGGPPPPAVNFQRSLRKQKRSSMQSARTSCCMLYAVPAVCCTAVCCTCCMLYSCILYAVYSDTA